MAKKQEINPDEKVQVVTFNELINYKQELMLENQHKILEKLDKLEKMAGGE